MDTKLTLRLDKEVIEKAKQYAQSRKMSLSRIIEVYLNLLTRENLKEESISPLVQGLSGVIDLPDAYNHKEGYTDYLSEKYK